MLDNEQYKQMCMDILENKQWYQQISFGKADRVMVELYSMVDKAFHNGV